jgi:hypothetical protein
MSGEATESTKSTNSIVNPEYAGKYRGASDFIGELIEEQCKVEITETTKSGKEKTRQVFDVDWMLNLAKKNNIDVTKLEKGKENANAAGRIRMSVGNMLRARAMRRHALYDLSGEVRAAPKEFLEYYGAPTKPTEDVDGNNIKPKKSEQKETASAEA